MDLKSRSDRWSIVLAGGDGRRCRTYCNSLYPDGRPKQFCALAGENSLVEETLDRALLFSSPDRTLVSVCREHLRWRSLWEVRCKPKLSVQPSNADTGPAALVAMMLTQRECSDATVAIFPSDHYVSDTLRFIGAVREAAIWVERNPDDIMVLGVDATYPETEYGWLLPRGESSTSSYLPQPAVLIEKPDLKVAKGLLARGACWNTSVIVVRTKLLLRLMEIFARDWWVALTKAFLLGGEAGDEALSSVYARLAPFNLSRDVLENCPRHLWMMPITGLAWSDLGSDERVRRHQRDHRHQQTRTRAPTPRRRASLTSPTPTS